MVGGQKSINIYDGIRWGVIFICRFGDDDLTFCQKENKKKKKLQCAFLQLKHANTHVIAAERMATII
jgi:hypothetical protein